jgi:hypothetical protein
MGRYGDGGMRFVEFIGFVGFVGLGAVSTQENGARMPKNIHHEEHEAHEEWNSVDRKIGNGGMLIRRCPRQSMSSGNL